MRALSPIERMVDAACAYSDVPPFDPKLAARALGEQAVYHLETMYPAALKAVPKTARLSLRNHVTAAALAMLKLAEKP